MLGWYIEETDGRLLTLMGKLSQFSCALGENGLWAGGWKELDDKYCGLSWLDFWVARDPCLRKEWLS